MRKKPNMVSPRRSRRGLILLGSCVAVAIGSFVHADTDTWTDAHQTHVWSDAANWSSGAVPNNGNVAPHWNVLLGAPATTTLDIPVTIDTLQISSVGSLGLLNGSVLTLLGDLTDDGTMTVNSNRGGNGTALVFGANATVGGTGTLVLNNDGDQAQLSAAANVVVTQAASHTISGFGFIHAPLINHGTVSANVGGRVLNLGGAGTMNDGTFLATRGATLDVRVAVNNAGGVLRATDNSVVQIDDQITGGTLQTAGSGAIVSNSGGLADVTIASGAAFILPNSTITTVRGTTLTNNGTITINNNRGGNGTALTFANNVLLTGSGQVLLNNDGDQAQFDTAAGATVTIDTAQTVHGFGNVHAAFVNNGLVQADFASHTLMLTSSLTNDATMRATNSAALNFAGGGINVTQGPKGQIVADGGTVVLSGGVNVVGGTLVTANGGTLENAGSNTLTTPTNTGIVNLENSTTLTLVGPTVSNSGTFVINSNRGGNGTTLVAASDLTVSGPGTIVLNNDGDQAQLNTATGVTLTQAAGHTISGFGNLHAALVNHGTVSANLASHTLLLNSNPKTNDALFQATSGAQLQISGIAVTNAGGRIVAGDGSFVTFDGGASVTGGAIASNGSGYVQTLNASFTGVTLGAGTDLRILNSTGLAASGTITNGGTITVNYNRGGNGTVLDFVADGTLTGGGTVLLNNDGPQAQLNTEQGATLTQSSGNTIRGFGQLNAALVNNGLVIADLPAHSIDLVTNDKTNNSTLEAFGNVNGPAFLNIGAITVTQSGGAQLLAGGGIVQLLSGARVNGGTLNASGNGFFQNLGVATIQSVTNNAPLKLLNSTVLNVAGGSLTNNGTITINSNQGSNGTALNFLADTALTGTGSVVLNNDGAQAQITAPAGVTVTVAPSQTIHGFGLITATLNNFGNIQADFPSHAIELQNAQANAALIHATNGGVVNLNGTGLTQTSTGTLAADAGTIQLYNNATVSGGTIDTPNGGVVQTTGNATLAGPIVNKGQINIVNNTTLSVTGGSLTNNGTITVNSNRGGNGTALNFVTDTTLSGTGSVVLNNSGDQSQIVTAPGVTLTQAGGHTVSGFGNVHAALVNHGTVNANFPAQTLLLDASDKTNDATLEASNGGILQVNGITIHNAGGAVSAAEGSVVNLNSATIAGGTISTADTGVFQTVSATSTLSGVTSTATINVINNTGLTIAGTGLVNNGSIMVDSNHGGNGTPLTIAAGATLTGTGALAVDASGFVVFAHNTTPLLNSVGSLSLEPSTHLDLANNFLAINYGTGPSPDAAIQAAIRSGQIASSDAAGNPTLHLVASDIGGVERFGLTIPGDANIDGVVNFTDLLILAQHYGKPATRWDQGDFNADGSVGFDDLLPLAQNYGKHAVSPMDALVAPVPEPAALSLALPLSLALRRRKRRPITHGS